MPSGYRKAFPAPATVRGPDERKRAALPDGPLSHCCGAKEN